jgi:hypothetical protein
VSAVRTPNVAVNILEFLKKEVPGRIVFLAVKDVGNISNVYTLEG